MTASEKDRLIHELAIQPADEFAVCEIRSFGHRTRRIASGATSIPGRNGKINPLCLRTEVTRVFDAPQLHDVNVPAIDHIRDYAVERATGRKMKVASPTAAQTFA